MHVYCITVPCGRVIPDAADEPLAAAAWLLAVLAAVAAWRRFASRHREPDEERPWRGHRWARPALLSLVALMLYFFSHGRFDQMRDTARFPSAACKTLGVRSLEHVPVYEWTDPYMKKREPERARSFASIASNIDINWRAGNATWQRGHYPYPACVDALSSSRTRGTSRPQRPLWVLMPASAPYVDVIGPWARVTRAAGLECVVGRLDRSAAVCDAAKLGGCRCVQSGTTLPTGTLPTSRPPGSFGRGSARAIAVRARFELAIALLKHPSRPMLLMHDADAAFTEVQPLESLQIYLRKLADGATPTDVAVLSNGDRREAFEALNWGFIWLSGSAACVEILECTLSSWDHSAFAPRADDPISGGEYYSRSQPRINHVLEAAIIASGGGSPRPCILPRALVATLSHATYAAVNSGVASDKVHWLMHRHRQGLAARPAPGTFSNFSKALGVKWPTCRHLAWAAGAPEKACFVQAAPSAWRHHPCPRAGSWELNDNYTYTLDRGLAAAYIPLFRGRSVLELGAGKGCYTASLLSTVRSIRAFDGAPNVERLTKGLVGRADLTKTSPALGGASDWVLSTKVGEHIPPHATDTFLDTIALHARLGVVLSWGIPGHPGSGHVNGRSNADVANRMAARSLCVDSSATAMLRKAAHGAHFKRTIQVYRRSTEGGCTSWAHLMARLPRSLGGSGVSEQQRDAKAEHSKASSGPPQPRPRPVSPAQRRRDERRALGQVSVSGSWPGA
jgi:hypothetical protein